MTGLEEVVDCADLVIWTTVVGTEVVIEADFLDWQTSSQIVDVTIETFLEVIVDVDSANFFDWQTSSQTVSVVSEVFLTVVETTVDDSDGQLVIVVVLA